ncbi:MAG TPA: GNAT family N-acetyltransferase [Polyangiales bacterium]
MSAPGDYALRPTVQGDERWLEALRREVYRALVIRTFGAWDEARHARHCAECLAQGPVSLIEVDGAAVGMLQLLDRPDALVIGEIQLQPGHQRRGLGTRVLRDVISHAHAEGRCARLSVAHKNEDARRLYRRLGFEEVARTDSHVVMELRPALAQG